MMHLQPSEACSLTDAGGAFDGLMPDELLLDSSANEVAEMIMHQLESSINSTDEEEHHAAPASWAPLLPAASGNLSPSASAAAGFGAPTDAVHMAGPIWATSLYASQQQQQLQQHEYAVPGSVAPATSDLAGHSSASGSGCTAAAPHAGMFTFAQHSAAAAAAGLAGMTAAGAAVPAAPFLLPGIGQYTSLMQRRDSCAGGSSTMPCNSPSSAPAFSAGGFLPASDDSSMPCGNDARAAAPSSTAGAPAVAGNKRKAAAQASQRRLRVQKQAAADTAKEQVSVISSKCSALQDKVDAMRSENSKLLGRLADITTKWQATVVENAALNAKNGEAQAQLGEMQHALAMMQRERDELRRALQQQQQQPALC